MPEYKKFETESRFEDLDDLIGRINDEMRDIGLEGRIITLESLSYEASNKHWKVDTECSLSCFSNKNVYILRIFYEFGEQTYERIGRRGLFAVCLHNLMTLITTKHTGIQDFSPNLIRKATFFKRPTFETFDKVIERASAWLQKQTKLQFINAQSIDIKMKSCKHGSCLDCHVVPSLFCLPNTVCLIATGCNCKEGVHKANKYTHV